MSNARICPGPHWQHPLSLLERSGWGKPKNGAWVIKTWFPRRPMLKPPNSLPSGLLFGDVVSRACITSLILSLGLVRTDPRIALQFLVLAPCSRGRRFQVPAYCYSPWDFPAFLVRTSKPALVCLVLGLKKALSWVTTLGVLYEVALRSVWQAVLDLRCHIKASASLASPLNTSGWWPCWHRTDHWSCLY